MCVRPCVGYQEHNDGKSLPSRNLSSRKKHKYKQVFRLVQSVTHTKRVPITYTDSHHKTITSKSQFSSFLKSKNCLAFLPLILNFAVISLASQAAAFSSFQSNQYTNILNSKKPLQLQIYFSPGIHVHSHLDLHDGVIQPKSASLPKKEYLTQ